MGSQWDGQKKDPTLLFSGMSDFPSALPICLSLKAVQWGYSQTGVIKKPSTKQRTPRDCQGQPNLDLCTNPMGGLPRSLSLSQGGWNMFNMVGGWCRWGHQSHATMHLSMRLTTQHVARWESKFITKSSRNSGKSSAECTRVLVSVSNTGK